MGNYYLFSEYAFLENALALTTLVYGVWGVVAPITKRVLKPVSPVSTTDSSEGEEFEEIDPSQEETRQAWDSWQKVFGIVLLSSLLVAGTFSGFRAAKASLLVAFPIWFIPTFVLSFLKVHARRNWGWLVPIGIFAFLSGMGSCMGYHSACGRSKVARSEAEMRQIATALETYYIDNKTYPPNLVYLTTPVAHLSSLPTDPFRWDANPGGDDSEHWYEYAVVPDSHWLLYSIGPDREDNEALWTYDPTNGTESSGDIFRTGP